MLLIASRFGEALRRSALSDLDHLDFVAEVALSHDHLAIFLKNNPVMSERKAKENSGEQAHIKTSLLSITDVGTEIVPYTVENDCVTTDTTPLFYKSVGSPSANKHFVGRKWPT